MPKLLAILSFLLCASAYAQLSTNSGANNGRIVLTEDRYYYVNCVKGSDANPGIEAQPWLTVSHAYNYARNKLDLGGRYSIFVKLQANCTGQNVMSGPLIGQHAPEDFTFMGDCADHAAIAVSASDKNQNIWYADNSRFAVRCMTVAPSGGGSGFLVSSGFITAGDIAFAGSDSNSWVNVAGPTSTFRAIGPISFLSGGTTNIGFVAEDHGHIALPFPLICADSPVFGAFVQADLGGMIDASGATVTHSSCKGQRYRALQFGIVFTGGTHDPNFFPGDTAGVVDLGYYE